MLAAAVYARKRLFVQQTYHSVAFGDLLHYLHSELVVVGSHVGGGEYGCEFVLSGRNLVMLGFGEYSEFPEPFVEFFHKLLHARLYRAEVMVFHLLTFGGFRAE